MFQTSAMLRAHRGQASVGSLSSIGIEKALIANENAANNPPTAVPTASIAQPTCGGEQHRRDVVETGERHEAEEQRIDDDGGAHPHHHQQAQQHAGEQDLAAGARLDEEQIAPAQRQAFLDAPALLIEADGRGSGRPP